MMNETTLGFSFNDMQKVHPLSPSSSSLFRTTSPVQSNTIDDVTTIFVVGFPEDMAEREFQNMFIFCRGFEAASLKWHCKDQEDENNLPSNAGKKQMIGFARFRTRLEALEAIEVLNGKKIDGDKGTVLKAEMAKKNLHIKRASATQTSTSTSSTTSSIDKRYESFSPLPSDLFQNEYMDSMLTLNESLFGIRSPSIDHHFTASSRSFTQSPPFHHHIQQQQQQQQQQQHQHFDLHYLSKSLPVAATTSTTTTEGLRLATTITTNNPADQNPPCNTLYVGNLPPNTQEDELKQIFSCCKGYRRMCFRTKPQGPMCFVEFDDIPFASQALSELQGHTLSNSIKGGIRLSFSKNPLFIKPVKHFTTTTTNSSNNNNNFIFDS